MRSAKAYSIYLISPMNLPHVNKFLARSNFVSISLTNIIAIQTTNKGCQKHVNFRDLTKNRCLQHFLYVEIYP